LAEVDAIANDPAAPTFANTLVPLEQSGEALNRVATLFFVMTSNMNDPDYQALSRVIQPMPSEVEDKVNFNAKLFARVKAVYDAREKSGLDPEQQRLVQKTYDDFMRRGAGLSPEKQAELGALNQKLAALFTDFS